MVPRRAPRTGNVLLDMLPGRTRLELSELCEPAPMVFGRTIYQPGDVIRHVYFPTSGYISLITPQGSGEALEVGLIGREGGFGVTVLLDIKTSPLQGLVQGDGNALRVSAEGLKRRASADPAIRKTLNRYLYVLMSQLAQSAACNRHHLLEARLARWLLMTQDRASSDTFRLTHVFLAKMLGVRRPGVTAAARRLQDNHLIRYERGQVRVVDRPRLEASSCTCYRASNAMYREYLAGSA